MHGHTSDTEVGVTGLASRRSQLLLFLAWFKSVQASITHSSSCRESRDDVVVVADSTRRVGGDTQSGGQDHRGEEACSIQSLVDDIGLVIGELPGEESLAMAVERREEV
jgi:hypothetical protein